MVAKLIFIHRNGSQKYLFYQVYWLIHLQFPGFSLSCFPFCVFLPRDAMLARYMLLSRVSPSVRPSVYHTPVLYQNGWS